MTDSDDLRHVVGEEPQQSAPGREPVGTTNNREPAVREHPARDIAAGRTALKALRPL
jgi:hypothetical protein